MPGSMQLLYQKTVNNERYKEYQNFRTGLTPRFCCDRGKKEKYQYVPLQLQQKKKWTLGASLRRYERCSGSGGMISILAALSLLPFEPVIKPR